MYDCELNRESRCTKFLRIEMCERVLNREMRCSRYAVAMKDECGQYG